MTTLKPGHALDVAGAAELDKQLMHVQPTDGEVVVDLSDVTFMASSGLRILLKNAQRLLRDYKAELVVANPNETVVEVLKMSGFDKIITVR
jgi:anti-anti-sigma factor